MHRECNTERFGRDSFNLKTLLAAGLTTLNPIPKQHGPTRKVSFVSKGMQNAALRETQGVS